MDRHAATIRPAGRPRAAGVTCTGAWRSSTTVAATGRWNRRRHGVRGRPADSGTAGSATARDPCGRSARRRLPSAGSDGGLNVCMATARSSWVSRSTGVPTRVSPINAPSRATSVDRSRATAASARAAIPGRSAPVWRRDPARSRRSPHRADGIRGRAGSACAAPARRESAPATAAAARGCARDQPQARDGGHRAAIGALERRRERLAQPREHERQRLEPLDRPLELEPLDEPRRRRRGHERDRVRAVVRPDAADAPDAPNRVRTSASGSRARSPSVRSPHRRRIARLSTCDARTGFRWWREGEGVLSGKVLRTSSGSSASAVASLPAGTIVISGGTPSPCPDPAPPACASSQAVVFVPATARRTDPSRPCSADIRRTASAIAAGGPSTRSSPLTSKTTASVPARSTRGEQARAMASSAEPPGVSEEATSRQQKRDIGRRDRLRRGGCGKRASRSARIPGTGGIARERRTSSAALRTGPTGRARSAPWARPPSGDRRSGGLRGHGPAGARS